MEERPAETAGREGDSPAGKPPAGRWWERWAGAAGAERGAAAESWADSTAPDCRHGAGRSPPPAQPAARTLRTAGFLTALCPAYAIR